MSFLPATAFYHKGQGHIPVVCDLDLYDKMLPLFCCKTSYFYTQILSNIQKVQIQI